MSLTKILNGSVGNDVTALVNMAQIRLRSGRIRLAELHWYEAHGIGRKEIKRKQYLD